MITGYIQVLNVENLYKLIIKLVFCKLTTYTSAV